MLVSSCFQCNRMQNIADAPAAVRPVDVLFHVPGHDDMQNSGRINQVPDRAVLPATRFYLGGRPRIKSGGQRVPVPVPRAPLELLVAFHEGTESLHQRHLAER